MDVGLLGPLAVHIGNESIVPEPAKPRQLLALLALQAEHVVPVPVLLDELWEGGPPPSAMTTLQTYVLHLRRMIAAAMPSRPVSAAKQVLATRDGGYVLRLGGGRCDLADFEVLASMGLHALRLGDPETASRLLGQALATWHGAALVDVEIGPRISAELQLIAQRRLDVVAARVRADLQLGRHAQLLGELGALTADHPMDESLCELRIVALCRSGRRSDALSTLDRLRRKLHTELGVGPGDRLHRLQQAVLNSDPGVDRQVRRTPRLLLG